MSGDTLIWSVIGALALVTYAIRYSFIGLIGDRKLPPALAEGLSFVPVTVLPALVAPAVFSDADGAFALDAAQVLAAAATVGVGVWLRGILPALIAGSAVYLSLAFAL